MKTEQPYIKTLGRLKLSNLAGRLLEQIERVMPPDTGLFQEVIGRAGTPEEGQSMRRLPFNRQTRQDGDATISLSLVALFNNTRMEPFFLKGLRERISRPLYRFSFSPMKRFIGAIRRDHRLLEIMANAGDPLSILGIVQRQEILRHRFFKRRLRFIAPLLLVPEENAANQEYILQFEARHTIAKRKLPLLPIYRRYSRKLDNPRT